MFTEDDFKETDTPDPKPRRMPGQARVGKPRHAFEDSSTAPRPAPAGAPRKLSDLAVGRCICKRLPAEMRPCGGCR